MRKGIIAIIASALLMGIGAGAQERPTFPIKVRDFADALNLVLRKNGLDLRMIQTECSPATCSYAIGEYSQAVATAASNGNLRELMIATSVPKQVNGQSPRYLGVYLAVIELLSKSDDEVERVETMKTMMRGATGPAREGAAELRGAKYKLSNAPNMGGLWLFSSPAR